MNPASTELVSERRTLYPALAGLDDTALNAVLARAQVMHVPAGTSMFGEGSPCRQFPLVLEGSIRVAKASDGRELQLYRVTPGESCVLTGGCLVGGRDYPATGVVERDARLVVLPKPVSDELLADELGSVREIVSRVLRGFSDQGWVQSNRGSIEVLDAAALRRVAEGH